MPTRRFPWLCAAAALLAACDATMPELPVRMEVAAVERPPAPVPVRVEGGSGAVTVDAPFEAPCMGRELRGAARRADASTVWLHVRAPRERGACPFMSRALRYRARIAGVDAGPLRVVVVHHGEAGAGGIVMDTRVTVE